jgi:hypothetical protein
MLDKSNKFRILNYEMEGEFYPYLLDCVTEDRSSRWISDDIKGKGYSSVSHMMVSHWMNIIRDYLVEES